MKALALTFVTLIALTSSAFASEDCFPHEAQVLSMKVVAARKIGTTCQIQVSEFNEFVESGYCPLFEGDVTGVWVTTGRCDLKVGDSTSGYLSKDKAGNITL